MNLLTFQTDYPVVSLSSIGEPVVEIEVPVVDIQVYEGIEGVMEDIEEPLTADLVEEQEMVATTVEEEVPTATVVDEEEMDGVLVEEEPMDGVFEDC